MFHPLRLASRDTAGDARDDGAAIAVAVDTIGDASGGVKPVSSSITVNGGYRRQRSSTRVVSCGSDSTCNQKRLKATS